MGKQKGQTAAYLCGMEHGALSLKRQIVDAPSLVQCAPECVDDLND